MILNWSKNENLYVWDHRMSYTLPITSSNASNFSLKRFPLPQHSEILLEMFFHQASAMVTWVNSKGALRDVPPILITFDDGIKILFWRFGGLCVTAPAQMPCIRPCFLTNSRTQDVVPLLIFKS